VRWHIIEGEPGCRYAVEHGCGAIIVDALRASATAAMLFDAGATGILAVREVEEALAAKQAYPEALLYGERGGLPPAGFDYGNSPREAIHARGRQVIFTTTTGAGRLLSAWGAAYVCMGSTVNARAVALYAASRGTDVVVIPAGLATDPLFDAQEDWAAAATVVMAGQGEIGEGRERFETWRARIEGEGLEALFAAAPHADKLRRVGLDADIVYCAQRNITAAVPGAVKAVPPGVWMESV